MKVKAKISFCGEINMRKGEERDLPKSKALSSLLKAGYVEEIKKASTAEN